MSLASPPVRLRTDYRLSLHQLYLQEVLANPNPLYRSLRTEDPVHWDPFLHAWVVTRYKDAVTVLSNFSAKCAPSPERLTAIGASCMGPVGDTLSRQMLFMDPPDHTRLRAICTAAFTPYYISTLRNHIQEIVDDLLKPALQNGGMDVLSDFADPLSSIVTAEILGLPPSDHRQLKLWSAGFARILGNFQHHPDRLGETLRSLEEMRSYFRDAIRDERSNPKHGLIHALMNTEIEGKLLTDDAVTSNCILLMVGGQETTPNLIGNGLLTLLHNPDQLRLLRANPKMTSSAIEELLRYEAPSQHTTRLAPYDAALGEKRIKQGQSVIALIGAANRDPERFAEPDRVDISRKDNKHLAFGAGGHYCFGASLARIEGEIAFSTLLRKVPALHLASDNLTWRENLGLRGLSALPVHFDSREEN